MAEIIINWTAVEDTPATYKWSTDGDDHGTSPFSEPTMVGKTATTEYEDNIEHSINWIAVVDDTNPPTWEAIDTQYNNILPPSSPNDGDMGIGSKTTTWRNTINDICIDFPKYPSAATLGDLPNVNDSIMYDGYEWVVTDRTFNVDVFADHIEPIDNENGYTNLWFLGTGELWIRKDEDGDEDIITWSTYDNVVVGPQEGSFDYEIQNPDINEMDMTVSGEAIERFEVSGEWKYTYKWECESDDDYGTYPSSSPMNSGETDTTYYTEYNTIYIEWTSIEDTPATYKWSCVDGDDYGTYPSYNPSYEGETTTTIYEESEPELEPAYIPTKIIFEGSVKPNVGSSKSQTIELTATNNWTGTFEVENASEVTFSSDIIKTVYDENGQVISGSYCWWKGSDYRKQYTNNATYDLEIKLNTYGNTDYDTEWENYTPIHLHVDVVFVDPEPDPDPTPEGPTSLDSVKVCGTTVDLTSGTATVTIPEFKTFTIDAHGLQDANGDPLLVKVSSDASDIKVNESVQQSWSTKTITLTTVKK